MRAVQKVSTDGWVRSEILGKILNHSCSGGALVWGRAMGDYVTNYGDIRGSACGFPAAGHRGHATDRRDVSWKQVTGKAVLQGAWTQPLQKYVDRR